MGELIRLATVSLDASADVVRPDVWLDADVWLDESHDPITLVLRADFPPVPWWRREGSRIVGRIGDQIVEVCDLDAPTQAPHPREVSQVRGVLAERVVLSTSLDPFLSLKALVEYSGFSRRTLLTFMAASDNVLPHYRVNAAGKIVVRLSDFDAWMQQFRRTQSAMDELIEQRRRERALRRMLRAEG